METESRRPRAVFDTNMFVAAHISKNPDSPTMELLKRWRRGEFELLYSDDLLAEVDEKFPARGISDERKDSFLVELRDQATYVKLGPSDVRPVIAADPDGDFTLACAVVGQASHIVTYDHHFDALGEEYQGIKIVDGLTFLRSV